MHYLLTATYTAPFRKIVVKHFDDRAEVSSMGDVSDDEELAAVNAGGGDLPGWTCSLS